MEIIEQFIQASSSYGSYVLKEISFSVNPWYKNYFLFLILLSLVVWLGEIVFPWRKNQGAFRKDFWLDAFYMFFNFYIFRFLFFAGIAKISSTSFSGLLQGNPSKIAFIHSNELPFFAQVIVFFIVLDFVQWGVHNLLHRVNFLWNFHQVHHSVQEMGFAAHLRYHWFETLIYEPFKYIALLLIGGFEPESVFLVYYINIAIGHINHANIDVTYGPLKYVLNNPRMHIWHHAKTLPKERFTGVNFGISLSIWDYIFGTNYIPYNGRDIALGFEDVEKFPKTFWEQIAYPFYKKR